MIALLLAATPYQTVPTAPVIGDVALGNLLRRYTSRVPHPALYAAVIRGRSFTVAAAGIANVPEPRPAAVTDRLRLGNGSSHFTFLLILRLAAAGILDLRHTPHHYFPETDPEASPYRRVTLAKLMPLAIASGDASGPMPDPREGEPPEEYAVRARAFATAAWLNGAKSKNRPNNQAYIIL
ncbi:MAG: hypothetical protein SFX74_00120, partial [Fimbriimonadaceae bacterium]|nr:hypothetical protein [Fimbriimonadaceae bacterium]